MFTPDKTPIRATRTIAARRTSAHSEHGKYDVLWWICYEEQCTEHHPMKERNGNEIRLQCIITTRDTTFIDGYDMKDLRERSGTFGTAKESSWCNKGNSQTGGKYGQDPKIFRRCINKTDGCDNIGWQRGIGRNQRTAPTWIIQTKSGAYRTESRKWLREMARLIRRTKNRIRRTAAEKPLSDSRYRVYNKNRHSRSWRDKRETMLCWACHDATIKERKPED